MSTPPKRKRLEKDTSSDPAISSSKFYCCRCGLAFSRLKGNFPASRSPMYRGTGYFPMCNTCMEELFERYCHQLGTKRAAMKRICMKLDLYWSDKIYDMVEKSAGVHSVIRAYISKTNTMKYIDKTYDQTIAEEEELINRGQKPYLFGYTPDVPLEEGGFGTRADEDIPDDIKSFWGPGYTAQMYRELEQRRQYWMSRFPNDTELDVGAEVIIRQICILEIAINQDRAAGRAIDRNVNMLNTLLGSANLKPIQKKDSVDTDFDNLPLGVLTKKWEETRPIPEPDPELKDVDKIVKYIATWFLGPTCKMFGVKNKYSKLYDDAMDRLRVNAPEYEDEDDDAALFNDIFADQDDVGGS